MPKVNEVKQIEQPTNSISSVDIVKICYEKGLFDRMNCIGRENAKTIDIYGVDKDRLVGYFDKIKEFNREDNNDAGVNSVEFISNTLDIEIFDTFVKVYRIPQHESIKNNIVGEVMDLSKYKPVDLDKLADDVARLLDEKHLGDNWIELFPKTDCRYHGNDEYIQTFEVTGPYTQVGTLICSFRTSKGRVVVSFKNGSEGKFDTLEEIARFIAGECKVDYDKENKISTESNKTKNNCCMTIAEAVRKLHKSNISEAASDKTVKCTVISRIGKIFLGDICYALNKDIYYGVWGKAGYEDGAYKVKDEIIFAVGGTAYGDGEYKSDLDSTYPVDAGVIGVVPAELWIKDQDASSLKEYGTVVDAFEVDFYSDGKGHFTFEYGNTIEQLNTDDTDDDRDIYDDYEDEWNEAEEEDEDDFYESTDSSDEPHAVEVEYVRNLAQEDYEEGKPFEDYEEFAKYCKEDGQIEPTEALFDVYFEAYIEASYEDSQDWDDDPERFDDPESPYYNGDLEDDDF